MPNSRGNRYSRAHKTLDPNQSPGKFWDFSWFEMGLYDLPVVIDSVLEQTHQKEIACVGHSQGKLSFQDGCEVYFCFITQFCIDHKERQFSWFFYRCDLNTMIK